MAAALGVTTPTGTGRVNISQRKAQKRAQERRMMFFDLGFDFSDCNAVRKIN
jgi:hypothetical protein